MSSAPRPGDAPVPEPHGHGVVLAYTRSGEERRKVYKHRFRIGEAGLQHLWEAEGRSGTDRRQGGDTLTAPDAPRDAGTGMARGARPRPADTYPLCGDLECRGCPTLRDLAAWNREQYRQANIALGLPENFHLPDAQLSDDEHDYTGPSFRRDQYNYVRLGVHPPEGKRWRLLARWGRAFWWRVPVQPRNVASPGLQWGSERVTPVDARPGGAGSLPLGRGAHVQPVERVADRFHVRAVKP